MNTDIIMMFAILALCVGLVPQIIKNFMTKTCGVALWTTLITTTAMWVLTWCFHDMRMWFSFGGCIAQGVLWSMILWQWFAYRPRPAKCGNCRHYWPINEQCRITKKGHWREHVCGRFKERK